jgi:hypothetical protein
MKMDLNQSSSNAVKFNDGVKQYKPTKPEWHNFLIFEVFRLTTTGAKIMKIESEGIAILPIF